MILANVQNCLVSQDQDTLLALAVTIVLHNTGRQDHLLVLVKQKGDRFLLFEVQKIA